MEATRQLGDLRDQVDEQARRLQVICLDYPDHEICKPETRFNFARKAFCEDPDFTKHVDEVVAACHQGECKQVDEAAQISRSNYMLLTQRLPHQLITFRASQTELDANDKKDLQHFLETIGGEKGYVIIVGRASKDGQWRKNLELALGRAEKTRRYLVDNLGMDQQRVGYITYGQDKMYLTELDAKRLSEKKLTETQANRSALIFSYPCYQGKPSETHLAPAAAY
jgi:outer membrane protein OmpA-like peptidoglycan-associated protein